MKTYIHFQYGSFSVELKTPMSETLQALTNLIMSINPINNSSTLQQDVDNVNLFCEEHLVMDLHNDPRPNVRMALTFGPNHSPLHIGMLGIECEDRIIYMTQIISEECIGKPGCRPVKICYFDKSPQWDPCVW